MPKNPKSHKGTSTDSDSKILKHSFKYRIYPTRGQKTLLKQTLKGCHKVYTILFEERKLKWEEDKKSLSLYKQQATLPKLKKEHPELQHIYSQVLQNVGVRMDLAFKAFFRRCKSKGEKPGYPKIKPVHKYRSFTYPQSGFKIIENESILWLSKIGEIKIKYHRPIIGKIKTCTIRYTPTHKWFASLSCKIEGVPKNKIKGGTVALSAGTEDFATLSNGRIIKNPRFFQIMEDRIIKMQRKLNRQDKNSEKRKKIKKILARLHEKVSDKRHDFLHKVSNSLVSRYHTIIIEDLEINKMIKNKEKCLIKTITDYAWGAFFFYLQYKAKKTGRNLMKINPAYTSQICARCGNKKETIDKEIYTCLCCGYTVKKSHNAALNILTLGEQSLDS